jgi:DNA-binding response OmpR family regulator
VKVLVVDDSLTIRRLVEISLRGQGSEVEFAVTGQEAYDRAKDGKFGCILLDYVLPDGRGVDVCRRLFLNPDSKGTPVILISANTDRIKDQFIGLDNVKGFLPKPFSAQDVVKQIAILAKPQVPVVAATAEEVDSERSRLESTARAVYEQLRPKLAKIPEWSLERGTEPVAAFFARKLLTPDLLRGLLQAVSAQTQKQQTAQGDDTLLAGSLQIMPGRQVLDLVRSSGRTCELRLSTPKRQISTYWRGGEILLATTDDPEEYSRGATFPFDNLPIELRDRVFSEQRTSGKPVFLSLAEASAIPVADVGQLLLEHGRRLIESILVASEGTFVWRSLTGLPPWVEAHGRGLRLAQVLLERLRKNGPSAQLDPDSILERVPGFSSRIEELQLSGAERRLLSVVDGRTSARRVSERADMDWDDARRDLAVLCEIGLARELGKAKSAVPGAPVVLWEHDEEGIHKPLEKWLRDRRMPRRLVSVSGEDDAFEALRREHPSLVIVNASKAKTEAIRLAREVTRSADLAGTSMVAVLEAPTPKVVDELWGAGFDAVLVKPIHLAEVERLLGG